MLFEILSQVPPEFQTSPPTTWDIAWSIVKHTVLVAFLIFCQWYMWYRQPQE